MTLDGYDAAQHQAAAVDGLGLPAGLDGVGAGRFDDDGRAVDGVAGLQAAAVDQRHLAPFAAGVHLRGAAIGGGFLGAAGDGDGLAG